RTASPPAGAGPLRVSVPVAGLPPATDAGLMASEVTYGNTVSVAATVAPGTDAESNTGVVVVTGDVTTEKIAEVPPAGTVTPAGTAATAGLALDRVTSAPPAGAGVPSVTSAVAEAPPATRVGLRLSWSGAGVVTTTSLE